MRALVLATTAALLARSCPDEPLVPRKVAEAEWRSVSLSADGTRIEATGDVFVADEGEGWRPMRRAEVWRVTDGGVVAARDPAGSVAETASVDGSVWVLGREGDLYRFADGRRTWITGEVGTFTPSPDGREVAVEGQGIFDADGSHLRELPRSGALRGWTEAGLVVCGPPCELVDADSGERRPLPDDVIAAAGRTLVTRTDRGHAIWRLTPRDP